MGTPKEHESRTGASVAKKQHYVAFGDTCHFFQALYSIFGKELRSDTIITLMQQTTKFESIIRIITRN